MTAIADYQKAAQELRSAEHWASLIGSPYEGGGGGVGSVVSAEVLITVYHQKYDGATNYHKSTEPLNFALADAVKRNHKALIESALQSMRDEAKALAVKAQAEHAALMKAAGLSAITSNTGG